MLMGLKPVSQVLSEAAVVMFTPKLRKVGDESIIEANAKLRDVAKYASSGSTVVNLLPTGVGGNADNVAHAREADRDEGGREDQLRLLPRRARSSRRGLGRLRSRCLGSKAASKEFASLGRPRASRSTYGGIAGLELEYISRVLALCTSMAAEVELMRKARELKVARGPEPRDTSTSSPR